MASHFDGWDMSPPSPDPAQDEAVQTVLVATGGAGTLHLPGDDGPRCAATGRFRAKPLDVYPPAHRIWCRDCRRLWAAHR